MAGKLTVYVVDDSRSQAEITRALLEKAGQRFTAKLHQIDGKKAEIANKSEAELAAAIQRFEIANLRARGSAGKYSPANVSTSTTTVGDKRLYVMSYSIDDASGSVMVRSAATQYYYLPSNFRDSGHAFGIYVEQPTKIGATVYDADLAAVLPVIASLETP